MNPASMFVGFISPKEFFSVINRKHVENHKLNLFDVNIDPIEFKLGLWNQNLGENEQELDNYFAYCVAANLNGYTFYSPANLANAMTMLAAVYFKEALEDMPEHFFVQALFSTYLLSFSMIARIKVFPKGKESEQFNWFVELFFDFYKMTFKHLDTKISKDEFETVKKGLLNQTAFFFLLYHFYKKLNDLLYQNNDNDHLDWLFGKNSKDKLIGAFRSNYHTTQTIPNFSPLEQSVMVNVWPSDILIKYLLGTSDPFIAVDTIINKIFPKTETDPLVQSFLKSGEKLNELFDYLLENKKYKYWFFSGIQNYVIKLFRAEGKEDILEDMDEMLSAIDNGEDINPLDMPERVKRESKVMERLLNFYVMMTGGMSTARGDSFYLRFNKPQLLNYCGEDHFIDMVDSPTKISVLTNSNFFYHKTRYYYEFINNQLRNDWKNKTLPVGAMPEDTSSNISVLNLHIQGAIAAFFQDLNPKEIRLTIKNPQILTLFREKYGSKISERVKKDKKNFIQDFYGPITEILWGKKSDFFNFLDKEVIDETDHLLLKECLYKLDFWMNRELLNRVKYKYWKYYGKSLSLGFFGQLRELLFGLLVLNHSIKKQTNSKLWIEIENFLKQVFVWDLLGIGASGNKAMFTALSEVEEEFKDFLDLWIGLDDNEEFLQFISKNMIKYLKKEFKHEPPYIWSDDLIRLRGLLKNLTYYNRRFIIPE